MSRDWSHGLFGCMDEPVDCLIGWCLPCILYGRADHRLKNPGDVNMTSFEMVNTPCLLWAGLACFTGIGGCVLSLLQRMEIREKYNIQGSTGVDVLTMCCCGCCGQIQQDHETATVAKQQMGQQPGAVPQMQYGGPPNQA